MQAGIRPFEASDYDAARALWERSAGVGLSEADERGAIEAFLVRNPGLSFVAEADGRLAGTVLCGHDGRRGLIHHLVTDAALRRNGIGRALLGHTLDALRVAGIAKCHLLVFADNAAGITFWQAAGAVRRDELALFSLST